MSSISVTHTGQFGNQLFQYCIGRILAERTGLDYAPSVPYFFDRQRRPLDWAGSPFFVMQAVAGRTGVGSSQVLNCQHWLDLDSIDPNRPIVVKHGWFQRYPLYQPYKKQIREQWLKIPEERYVATDSDALYVHVRRTDYVLEAIGRSDRNTNSSSSGLHEFAACLPMFPGIKRLILLSDAPGDGFLQQFGQLGLPFSVEPGNWVTDFLKMASCRNLLISQSTFSWWAGFLGRAERISCPITRNTYWYNGATCRGQEVYNFPDLYVADEPGRWHWIITDPDYKPVVPAGNKTAVKKATVVKKVYTKPPRPAPRPIPGIQRSVIRPYGKPRRPFQA